MRRLLGFLCVCVLVAVPLAGCSETPGGIGGSGIGGSGSGGSGSSGGMGGGGSGGCPDPLSPYDDPRCFCPAELSDYCEGSDCPTLDQAVADAVEFAQDNCGIGVGCFAAEAGAGRCGDLRFVYTSCGEGYSTRQYFDATGMLGVVDVCSDTTEYCNGSLLCMRYGPDPACAFEAEEDLCQTFDGDQGGGANPR